MTALPSEETAGWVWAWEHPEREVTNWGKWLVFVSLSAVDSIWDRIRVTTEAGALGGCSKAGAFREKSRGLICVYCDADDPAEVGRTLATLRRLGIRQQMSFKTDAASRAGVYGEGAASWVAHRDSWEVRVPYQNGRRKRSKSVAG